MTRLGTALGAATETFAGLSGMGDLIVTCTSRHSRNRAVGERLGKGETIDEILDSMAQVAEGVWNCDTARELAHKAGVEMPIAEQAYRIVREGVSPLEAVQSLMSRDVRPETDH
jgi:glycerol-3-phosphate dehydrogenase (NAD(P)+)